MKKFLHEFQSRELSTGGFYRQLTREDSADIS